MHEDGPPPGAPVPLGKQASALRVDPELVVEMYREHVIPLTKVTAPYVPRACDPAHKGNGSICTASM